MKAMFATIAAIAAAMTMSASADLIAYWDFNEADLAVSQGAGTLTHNFDDSNVVFFTGTTVNALDGVPSGSALALQNGTDGINNGAWIQFSISTAGLQDLVMSFASQRTSTGFEFNQVSWSSDGGGSFTDLGGTYTPASSFAGTGVLSFDFSGISALNDNADVVIRITFDGGSTTSSAGNNRIDNVQFNANVIPAPGALALLGMAGLAGVRRRRSA